MVPEPQFICTNQNILKKLLLLTQINLTFSMDWTRFVLGLLLCGFAIACHQLFDWLFGLMLYVPVNSYGHVGMDSSPNLHFFPGQAWLSSLTSTSCTYSKTWLKRPLKKKTKIGFQDRLSLITGQTYCRMLQESILQYFWPALSDNRSLRPLIVLSIFEWPLKRCFTVPKKLFHDQSPRKYGTGPGSNLQPLDLQSDMLST